MFKSIRPYQIVLLVCAAYLLLTVLTNGGDSRVFVTLGDCFAQCSGAVCTIGPENGYDGQFAYYIARDPANAAPCIDAPAYRYQRILLPIMGRVLALGITELIPLAFVVINLIALVGSTALLENLLETQKVSRVYALAYGLFGGLVIAVRLSTSEPLAYGLVVLAIWLGQGEEYLTAKTPRVTTPSENEKKPAFSALSFVRNVASLWFKLYLAVPIVLALAALAKETTVLFVVGYGLYYLVQKRWGAALILALVVGIPFALWQITLYNWFGTFGVGSGGAGGTPFEIIPFMGIIRILTEGKLSAFLLLAPIALIVAALPALWGLINSAREIWREKSNAHLYAYLLFINAAVMLFVPFSTYREPLGILRFIPGLVFAHVLFAALRYRHRRPLRYSLLWAVTLLFPLVLR
jgi:hypothetical protein